MGLDTHGRIKGFVRHEEILNFIRQKWDKDVKDIVKKKIYSPISECDWRYKINEHSEDNENWYIISGFIFFQYNYENRMLFYMYENINSYENLEFYSNYGLKDMVESEVTLLSLGYWGSSVEIMKELVAHFGGGWIDENDCDDEVYYPVEMKTEYEDEINPDYAGSWVQKSN